MSGKLHLYLRRLSIFLVAAALIAGMVGCDGNGSQNLEIRTWYDLDAIRDNPSGDHTLMNDLDSTTLGYEELASPTANGGKGWQSIYSFRGTLDGQGHEIRDLFINRSDQDREGLFSLLYKGVINNIGVVNVTVIGSYYIGGLAGENDQGTINNSYCTGNMTGDGYVGGLVGFNEGTVSNSYFRGRVTSDGSFVGGLVGWNQNGTVSNAYYNHDEVMINGENIITIGALFGEDFDQWLANGKFLDVNARLSQEDGYYVVNNATDFKELLAFGQNGTLKFRLTNDLDLGSDPNFYIPYLAGEFDGDGYKISNLNFNFSFISQVGLFGYLASGGILYEVAADNVSIAAYQCIGGLIGWNREGNVSNSYSTGSVTSEDWWVGGLVGMNSGTVSNSYSTSNVTGDYFVGGLVGYNGKNAAVSNSYSSGKVSGSHVVGGLVGDSRGTVSNSCSSGTVSGISDIGGLAGRNIGHMSNCYSTGSVTGNGDVGGLVGRNSEGTVSNSYSTASVNGGTDVGGLVGINNDGGTVNNCYSTGSVTGNSHVGGLVGSDYSVPGTSHGIVSNSFWDTQTSGQATSDGGTGKTTAQMQDIATFSGAAWDIIAVGGSSERNPAYIWNIVNNVTYPFLSWEA